MPRTLSLSLSLSLLSSAVLFSLACSADSQTTASPDDTDPASQAGDLHRTPGEPGPTSELVEDAAAAPVEGEVVTDDADDVEGPGQVGEAIDRPEEEPAFEGRSEDRAEVQRAQLKIEGKLDKKVIERVVQAHSGEVRSCYNQGLVKNPELSGWVEVQFVIDAKGKVTSSRGGEDFPDPKVGRCIARAVERWQFPEPAGGTVPVLYPFELRPD